MTIIKTEKTNEFYPFQSQSHRTENWMGDGWAVVPPDLESKLMSLYPFVVLTVKDVVVTTVEDDVVARRAWEETQKQAPPTPDQDRDAMLIDLQHRMTLLELGVK